MLLDGVSIVIPTFLRPGYLRRAVIGALETMPECETIVACDDDGYTMPTGDVFIPLPFDRGLTVKRNVAVSRVTTEYTLIASDDFDLGRDEVPAGVSNMLSLLKNRSAIDVVVGTYNDRRYEGTLEYVPGEYIREIALPWSPELVQPIEIGINYFLARTKVLQEVPWDETIRPIGGEHGDWFFEMKQRGKKIVWFQGCNVHAMEGQPEWAHPDYMKYRHRAMQGHEIMLKKRGIKRWIGFGEQP